MEDKKAGSSVTLLSSASIEVTILQRCLWVLNTFFYQMLAIVTIVMFWVFFELYAWDSFRLWHLVFSTAAYIPLMAVAIILFSEDNLTTIHMPRTKRYNVHGILLSISCVAITVGIAVETHSKTQRGSSHFQSDHAILGLVSWILIFVSVLIGLVTANTRTFSTFIRPIVVKLVHNVLGLAAYAIGIGSLYVMLGLIQRGASETIYKGVQVGVIFVTIWSGLAALNSLVRQIKGAFS